MAFAIQKAVRRNVPLLISIAGQSGSGKTMSALLLAAGLAGDGKVGVIDTENKRASLYADTDRIKAALPNGYEVIDMDAPFAPARYTEAVQAFEQAGASVLVIDSMTHEWEGYGGCSDIAENNKMRGMPNWILAKREHKRMMNHLLATNMHIIFCLRAREKVKVAKNAQGKEEFVAIGLQPIQEKGFVYEMAVSVLLDDLTHKPTVLKCPEPLLHLFQGEQPLISKAMGEKLRAWSEAAPPPKNDPTALAEQALAYAADGTEVYQEFWKSLTPTQQKELLPRHEEFKELARMADNRKREADTTATTLLPELQY